VRAKTSIDKSLIDALSEKLQRIIDEWEKDVEQIIEKKKKGIAFDEDRYRDLENALADALEKALLAGLDEALHYGIDDASRTLNIEIQYSEINQKLIDVLEKQEVALSQSIGAKLNGNAKQALLESQRLGENLQQTIDRLRSISTLSQYEAERIARTELSKAANSARLEGYRGRVDKVEWVLGPSYNGNCACGDYAGVHTLNEAQSLPMGSVHPNCDCYWEPVIEIENE
jgi:hypothetical protein